jgi:methyl-accepting chemotaxis protein
MNVTWSIGRRLATVFGGILLIQVVVSGLALFSFMNLEDNNSWVRHTDEVIEVAEELFSALQDTEDGERGYIITGLDSFLQPYTSALPKIAGHFTSLRELTSDNPEQQRRLDSLKPLIASELEELKHTIEVRRSSGFGAARALVIEEANAHIMRNIRETLTAFIEEEKSLKITRSEAVDTTSMIAIWTIIIGGLAAIVFTIVAGLALVRSIVTPLTSLGTIARKIGDGDISVEVTGHDRQDEIGALALAFRQMVEALRAQTEEMSRTSEEIARQSDELQAMLGRALAFVETVSNGDLTGSVTLEGGEDLVRLGNALNEMNADLVRITKETTSASNATSSSTSELKAAVSSLSSGASQQAASVNETTTTLEEIKATSAQTLSKAQQFGDVAERTRREGEQGVEAVEEAIRGIESIRERMDSIAQTILALSEQTQQIGDITTVVSNIAQQSKMLALNASIEAAKAGEAGQGFSVVAAEVRDLAEQSQQSSAQVQQILQDIRHATDRAVMATEEGAKGVDTGVDLVSRSSEAIKQLSDAIREASLASQQIVAAVRQEAAGIDQVSTAMNEINKITAQFVTSTKQSEQATNDLIGIVTGLQKSVSAYKL